MTEFAFNECVSICASGQNPNELKWIAPGSCMDSNFCGDNEFCELLTYRRWWKYGSTDRNKIIPRGWGVCRPCEQLENEDWCDFNEKNDHEHRDEEILVQIDQTNKQICEATCGAVPTR